MKWLRGLFFASFISVMIAMLISFLPKVELSSRGHQLAELEQEQPVQLDQPVFQVVKPIRLEQSEVVAFLKPLHLNHAYKKVRIDKQELFVDIKVTKEEYNNQLIYQDSIVLMKHVYKNTSNINQLFIRFILLGEDHNSLILSVTASRNPDLLGALSALTEQDDYFSFLTNNTELVFGTGWSEK